VPTDQPVSETPTDASSAYGVDVTEQTGYGVERGAECHGAALSREAGAGMSRREAIFASHPRLTFEIRVGRTVEGRNPSVRISPLGLS
jgi:hypothetical protein